MTKKIQFGHKALSLQVTGVNLVADAVKITLGPKGRNVVIDRSYGGPFITKDGASVAKEIDLPCNFQNVGAQLIKQVSANTAEETGDGTTTATVLAQSIIAEGLIGLSSGISPVRLKKGMDMAVALVIDELKSISSPCKSEDTIRHVASVSSNNDSSIGNLIAAAVSQIGENGNLTVTEGRGFTDELEVVKGLKIDKGYASPYFVSNPESSSIEFDQPYILITDQSITSLKSLVPLLEQVAKTNRPLLIISANVEGDALSGLIYNNMRGILKVVAVKAPDFGDGRKNLLEDIAVVTGANMIASETGYLLDEVKIDSLGQALRVKITRDSTTIIGADSCAQSVSARIRSLKSQIDETSSAYSKDKLKERLAKLSGGIAVIKVGAATDLELKEKKDRIEDAVNATRAAIENGIVPGGGVALLKCKQAIDLNLCSDHSLRFGMQVILNALEAPLRQIVINGAGKPDLVVEKILSNSNPNWGFDASDETFGDLIDKGVIDPAKVTITSLKNAASIAGLILTTDAVIVSIDEEKGKIR